MSEHVSTESSSSPSTLFLLLHQPSENCKENTQQLYLLGTVGCHLCEQAERLVEQVQAVVPFRYDYVDIIDLPDEWLEQLSTKIPVLISDKRFLNYPFSVLDIQCMILDG